MSGKKSEWVYDELLCFLGSAFFQVPVTGFIEGNCLIFDPSVEDSAEYKALHQQYKKVVQALLDAFTEDTKLTHDEVVKALTDMNSKKDIREIFQGLFEQVFAMDDFEIFVRLMTQKNIELQQQALILLIKTTGGLPESLTEGGGDMKAPPAPGPGAMDSDDEIMRRVLEQSKREYDKEQKKLKKQETKDREGMAKILEVSKHEVSQLETQKQAEKQKLNAAMASLSLADAPPVTQSGRKVDAPPVTQARPKVPVPQKPVVQKFEQPVITTPGASSISLGPGLQPKSKLPGISSSEAAANWMKSAQSESTTDSHADAVQKAAAAMANMSADELKKRQEYLREQRDKLVAMKKKEREKQLLSAEQSNPERPMSSRAARQTLQGETKPAGKQISEEEQKKIEMRKAIASKLKAELLGGN